MPLVSIIVVTSGAREYWRLCLASCVCQSYKNIEVIVVDNSAYPQFASEITSAFPSAQYYSAERNLLYGQGLNEGIARSKGDFLLCMNDDVILEDEYIAQAIRGFEVSPRIGMVSGKIFRIGRGIIDSTGLCVSLFRTAKERGYGRADKSRFNQEGYIFGVSGALAFYRRQAIEETARGKEYFDSRLRMFYEDLDVAWRLQQKGWRGYYIPTAVACHARGASVRQGKGLNKGFARRYLTDELYWELVKNRYIVIAKNETFVGLLLCFPFILAHDIVSWAVILFTRPWLFCKIPSLWRLQEKSLKPSIAKERSL